MIILLQLDNFLLTDADTFGSGMVRAVAMRFWQGSTDVTQYLSNVVAAYNASLMAMYNATNVTGIWQVPLPGPPILAQFAPTQAEVRIRDSHANHSRLITHDLPVS